MPRTNKNNASGRRTNRWLPCLLGGLAFGGAALAAQGSAAATDSAGAERVAPRTTYRVVQLGTGTPIVAKINASGQVAFSQDIDRESPVRALFYDGSRVRDIGTLGGDIARITGLNNVGEVAGISRNGGGEMRSFVWTRQRGMRDLGVLAGATEAWEPVINNRGDMAGYSAGEPLPYPHAFRWSAAGGMRDLGLLVPGPDSTSYARAINDSGTIAGTAFAGGPSGNAYHAFIWTRTGGMADIDTLANNYSDPVAIGAGDLVAGNFLSAPDNTSRAFVWTRKNGMRDLGTLGGTDAAVNAMSAGGRISGLLVTAAGRPRAMTWTQAGGLRDLGTLGGTASNALGANDRGQVVGGATAADDLSYRAFVWSAQEGMVDLNRRLRSAPPGFTLYQALAISDCGAIVASSNTGTVLLRPDGGGSGRLAGPIEAPEQIQAGSAFTASIGFVADAAAAGHKAVWSWGDGSADQTVDASERSGGGSAGASHSYAAPGVYTVTARIVDRAGQGAAVSRRIVVQDPAGAFLGGAGTFLSPPRAGRLASSAAGMADFSFVAPAAPGAASTLSAEAAARAGAPAAAQAGLRFNSAGLHFRSKTLAPVGVQGGRAQFAGSGTVNDTGDYRFAMAITAGAAVGKGEPARFSLRIWHLDPATRAEVVDYDSGDGGNGAAGRPLVDGRIAVPGAVR